MIAKIVSVLLVVAYVHAAPECPKTCSGEGKPYCVSDGETFKLYDNECEFLKENCHDLQKWHTDLNIMHCMERSTNPNCLKQCPQEGKPVCVFDGEHYELFDNECEFEKLHCNDLNKFHRDYNLFHCMERQSKPDNCIRPCPLIYAPLCATNEKTFKVFDNKCQMEGAACEDKTTWHETRMIYCAENPKLFPVPKPERCPLPCPKIMLPVCGFDGERFQLFDNECILRSQYCEDKKVWVETTKAVCMERM